MFFLFFFLRGLVHQTICLEKRYAAGLRDIDLSIPYNGTLTSSVTCQGHTADFGSYPDSYIIAGAPLTTAYGDIWEDNPVYFGFFHGSTGGRALTDDNIYGLQFATAAWPADEDGLYNTFKPGERLLDLSAAPVTLEKTSIGEEEGYTITGDQRSLDTSAVQPNSVGIYFPRTSGCGSGNLFFDWTQSMPFKYSIGFSNTTAWFSLVSEIGNGTTVAMNLNATRVLDKITAYTNIVLDTNDEQKPVFVNPTASSSTSAAPAATSSSAAVTAISRGKAAMPRWCIVLGMAYWAAGVVILL